MDALPDDLVLYIAQECANMTTRAIVALSATCKRMRELITSDPCLRITFDIPRRVANAQLCAMIHGWHRVVRYLDLLDFPNMETKTMKLVSMCTKLEILEVRVNATEGWLYLDSVLRKARNLRACFIGSVIANSDGVHATSLCSALRKCKNLSVLVFWACNNDRPFLELDDYYLWPLRGHKCLQTLIVANHVHSTHDKKSGVSTNWSYPCLTKKTLKVLASCPNLKTAYVGQWKRATKDVLELRKYPWYTTVKQITSVTYSTGWIMPDEYEDDVHGFTAPHGVYSYVTTDSSESESEEEGEDGEDTYSSGYSSLADNDVDAALGIDDGDITDSNLNALERAEVVV